MLFSIWGLVITFVSAGLVHRWLCCQYHRKPFLTCVFWVFAVCVLTPVFWVSHTPALLHELPAAWVPVLDSDVIFGFYIFAVLHMLHALLRDAEL